MCKVGEVPVDSLMYTSFGSTVVMNGVCFSVTMNGVSKRAGWSIQDSFVMWVIVTFLLSVAAGFVTNALFCKKEL